MEKRENTSMVSYPGQSNASFCEEQALLGPGWGWGKKGTRGLCSGCLTPTNLVLTLVIGLRIIQRPMKQWVALSSSWGWGEKRVGQAGPLTATPKPRVTGRGPRQRLSTLPERWRTHEEPSAWLFLSTGSDFTRVRLRHQVFFNSSRRF